MGVYKWVTQLRNYAFDRQWAHFKTRSFPQVWSICVGNLSMGGTGKTPMVSYLAEYFLKENKKIVIISLGYKRKKKGEFFATLADNAQTIGDEPAQYLQDFRTKIGSQLGIYLCKRKDRGVESVLRQYPNTEVILFDDGFQHRYVKAQKTLLLTTYHRPYFKDKILPFGHLRESIEGRQRAEVVLMTKCPENLTEQERQKMKNACGLYPHQKIFFSSIFYQKLVNKKGEEVCWDFWARCKNKVILVTGIAYPQSMLDYIQQQKVEIVRHFQFPDHHRFTQKEIKEVERYYSQSGDIGLLTTQKDFMRISAYREQFPNLPWHYMTIRPNILFNQENEFLKAIEKN